MELMNLEKNALPFSCHILNTLATSNFMI